MKKLILQMALFALIGIPLYAGVHRYIYTHLRRPLTHLMREAVEKASRRQPYGRVIVGDSVARQLFNDRNQRRSRYFHLTTNAATTLMGHYILLMEYLKRNPTEEIVVLLHPYSLMDNLNREFTANYVVGMFYRKAYQPYITAYAEGQIKNCAWWFVPVLLRDFPELCKINYQTVNPKPFWTDNYLSPLSLEYFGLLRQACRERGITLRVMAPPLSAHLADLDYSFTKKQVEENGLSDCFAGYFDFIYLPTSSFADELHPKSEFLDDARRRVGLDWEKPAGELAESE